METSQLKFGLNHEEVIFNVCQSKKQPKDIYVISIIHIVNGDVLTVHVEECVDVKALVAVIMNFEWVILMSIMGW